MAISPVRSSPALTPRLECVWGSDSGTPKPQPHGFGASAAGSARVFLDKQASLSLPTGTPAIVVVTYQYPFVPGTGFEATSLSEMSCAGSFAIGKTKLAAKLELSVIP